MQENGQLPRESRALLLEQEKAVLARLTKLHTHPPRAVLVDGDQVAIFWVFDMTDGAGVTRRREEPALQTWRGDRIQTERFFYDPAEFKPI